LRSETVVIRPASGAADLAAVRQLFLAYAQSLNFSLCFQGFDEEVATLPGAYAPPRGSILLGFAAAQAVGVVAYRPLAGDICEMKRLYVRPEARKSGLGPRLARAIIAAAGDAGYRVMRLDTHESMVAAMALYRGLGFVEIPAYYDNPLNGVHYFERALR
jgi:putative acetyltransferase